MSYLVILVIYLIPFWLVKPEGRWFLFKLYALAAFLAFVGFFAMFLALLAGSSEYQSALKNAIDLPISIWILGLLKESSNLLVIIGLASSLLYTIPVDILLCVIIVNFKAPHVVLYGVQIAAFWFLFSLMDESNKRQAT